MVDSKKPNTNEDKEDLENNDSNIDFVIESEDWDEDWEGVELDDDGGYEEID